MKKFRFPLRSVATVRNIYELRAREHFSRTVQACVTADKTLESLRTRVAELEQLLRSGRLQCFRPADQTSFMAAFKEENVKAAKAAAEAAAARATMETARQAWLQSRRDVRVIENLEQKRRAIHRSELERENQAAMDDRASSASARSASQTS